MASKRKRSNDDQSTILKNQNRKKIPSSGSIVDCFRKQQQQKARTVHCPMCDGLVLYNEINLHLDNGCISLKQDEGKRGSLTGKEGKVVKMGLTREILHFKYSA